MLRPVVCFLRAFTFLLVLPFTAALAETAVSAHKPDAANAEFQRGLNALASPAGGIVSVAVRDLTNGNEIVIDGDRRFSQAGLSKMYVLAAVLRESSAGRIDLQSPHKLTAQDKIPGGILHRLGDGTVTMSLHDYASLMVSVDDNSATNILLSRVGIPAVNQTLGVLNSSNIRFVGLITDPKKPDDNLASARDIVRFLAQAYEGTGLDPSAREEFFSLLSTSRLGAVRTTIPRSIRVASKSGTRGQIRSTAGVVFLKNHPYAIAILTQFSNREESGPGSDAAVTISDISELAYAHFSKLEPAEPSTESLGQPRTPAGQQPSHAR